MPGMIHRKNGGNNVARRTALILLLMLLACAQLALCEEIVLSFWSGDCFVDLEGEGRWVKAAVDMRLHTYSVVRTGKNGQAEIMVSGESVALGSETVIKVDSIVENLQVRDRMSWFQKVSRRFVISHASRDDKTESATLGIRGDLEGDEEMVWLDYHDDDGLEQGFIEGKTQYDAGNYARAITIFRDLAHDDQGRSLNGELSFYLGASLFNSVQYEEALPFLREAIRDREVHYREAALLYYSFSCFFTGQHNRAIDGFITYVEEFEEGELLPYALLMLGKSYKAVGDSKQATMYFRDIEEHYSHTEAYHDAVQELGVY